MPILILFLYLHRQIFLMSNNLIYFIMKRKKYFFTRCAGFPSESIYFSVPALKKALLKQFDKGYGTERLFVHHIDGCNIYFCGSVSSEDFDNDFNKLEFYD